MKAFLDTNVLLDILMDSRINHYDSSTILRVAEKGVIQAVMSTQSIVDASYVFSQKEKLSLDSFKSAIRFILSIVTVASIDENDIKAALRSSIGDFEDSAQISCAMNAGCDVIISSDRKWKGYTVANVYSPKEFCDLLFGDNTH